MRHLDRSRFEPLLVGPPGPIHDLAVQSGIRTRPYTFEKRYISIQLGQREVPVNPYRLAFRLRDALWLAPTVRRERIALVHTNNLDAHLTGWFLNKLFRVPVIWHIRTFWPRSFYRIPWPTRIVFVSDAVKDKAIGPDNTDPQALVIYNGIDPADFAVPHDARESVLTEFDLPPQPLVGIVGRLTPWKRHDLFLRAAADLKRRGVDATWLIIGSEIDNRSGSSHTRYLESLCRELDITDRVVFTGLRSDIARLVGALDVFVSASDDDPNPRTVLEAMVMGRSIVATNCGGVPTMLAGGRTGLLVPKGNAGELAKGIARLLADPDAAARLAQAARERATTTYTIQEHVHQIEELYESLLCPTDVGMPTRDKTRRAPLHRTR